MKLCGINGLTEHRPLDEEETIALALLDAGYGSLLRHHDENPPSGTSVHR